MAENGLFISVVFFLVLHQHFSRALVQLLHLLSIMALLSIHLVMVMPLDSLETTQKVLIPCFFMFWRDIKYCPPSARRFRLRVAVVHIHSRFSSINIGIKRNKLSTKNLWFLYWISLVRQRIIFAQAIRSLMRYN